MKNEYQDGKYQTIKTDVTILKPMSVSAMPQRVARTSSRGGSRSLVGDDLGGNVPKRSEPNECPFNLEETNDPTFLVDIDVLAAWFGSKAGHGAHLTDDRVDEAGADRRAYLADL